MSSPAAKAENKTPGHLNLNVHFWPVKASNNKKACALVASVSFNQAMPVMQHLSLHTASRVPMAQPRQ